MTLQEFIPGMERLRSVFGDRLYPEERVRSFFGELRGMDHKLWLAVVDRLVKEESKPPMMREIRLAFAAEKERHRELEKSAERRDAERFFQTVKIPEEIRCKFPHLFKKTDQIRNPDQE